MEIVSYGLSTRHTPGHLTLQFFYSQVNPTDRYKTLKRQIVTTSKKLLKSMCNTDRQQQVSVPTSNTLHT